MDLSFDPLVPYLDSLRWVFVALALAGISVAVWAKVDIGRAGDVVQLQRPLPEELLQIVAEGVRTASSHGAMRSVQRRQIKRAP